MRIMPQMHSRNPQYSVCSYLLIMSFVYFTIAACADRCTTDISCVAYHYDEETNDCLLIPKVQDLSHI